MIDALRSTLSSPNGYPPERPATLEAVKEVLRQLIEQSAGIPAASIRDSSTVEDDLAIDSLSFIHLQVAVERRLGVECDPLEIIQQRRFDKIAMLVLERMQEQ